MINTLQIDDVIILIKRRIIKFVYQIKDFVRFDYEFIISVKSFINEIINYIIIRYLKSIDFVIEIIIDQVERKATSRSNLFELISYFSID